MLHGAVVQYALSASASPFQNPAHRKKRGTSAHETNEELSTSGKSVVPLTSDEVRALLRPGSGISVPLPSRSANMSTHSLRMTCYA